MKETKLRYVLIICFTITIKEASFAAPETLHTENHGEIIPLLEGWQNFENKFKNLTNAGIKKAAPVINNIFGNMNFSDDCIKNVEHLMVGLDEIKPWAVKFIDASAKFIDGILVGSFSSFGSFDECLNIEVKNPAVAEEELTFRGQYCTIEMLPSLPPKPKDMQIRKIPEELKNFSQRDTAVAEFSKDLYLFYKTPFRLGVCLPSGCSIQDVDKMAQLLGKELSLSAKAARCEEKEETTFTPLTISVIILFCVLGFLFIVGSSIELYSHYSKNFFKNIGVRILLAFSFLSNFKTFSSPAPKSNNLNCLYGIRFIAVVWIIFGNGMAILAGSGVTHDYKVTERITQNFIAQFFINMSICVDTFMFMGGMLVCYSICNLSKNQEYKWNVFEYIIHRLWRILPSYFFVIMAIFLIPMLGSGPIWHDSLDDTLESCRKNWWANLLFIQNFYDTDHTCFIHFWYLAVDFQLYVNAFLFLWTIIRWPKIGVSWAVLTIIASACYSGILTYIKELPPTLLITVGDKQSIIRYAFELYFNPFTHAGSYTIGHIAGFLLSTKPKIKIPRFMLVMGWCFSFTLMFLVIQGTLPWYRNEETSLAIDIAYASLNRIAWTLAIAWIIMCCAYGHGGIINHILSLRVLVPLGRISYLAYLIHLPMQYVFIANIRTRIQSDIFLSVCIFCGHVFISYALAFLFYVVVEAPFTNLEVICFPRRRKKEENFDSTKEQDTFTMDMKSAKNGDSTSISTIQA